jgi:hypothetical protein
VPGAPQQTCRRQCFLHRVAATDRPIAAAYAVAFLAAHPVVALYIVNGGRNDILVGVALLGAAVLASQGRERQAGVVGGFGALIKLTGLVGIVALVVTLATARGRGAAQRAATAALAVVTAGYLVAGSAAVLTPMNTAGAMFSRGSVWKLATHLVVPSHLALSVLGVVVVRQHRGAHVPLEVLQRQVAPHVARRGSS